MSTARNLKIPASNDVRSEAVGALIAQMGITKTAMFIRESMSHNEDYLKIKDELFGKKSVEQLVEEIKSR